jgi:cobaltochelatase CobS
MAATPLATDLLNDLGRRWAAGAKMADLSREARVSGELLRSELARLGYASPYGRLPGQAAPADLDALARKVAERLPAQAVDAEAVRSICREEIAQLQPQVPCFQVQWPDDSTVKIEGKAHAKFARVLKLAAARRNVLLVGPAGTGKTHLAQQVAQALGLDFAFISCSAGMSEGQLMGRLVPTGEGGKFEYLRSEFVRCYEEGGVFLFDEMDAADSNTMIVINSALANGHMAVPNRPESPVARKHPDFVCIAAANTFGTGADRQYVGRNQMDEATLDRFRIG